MAYTPHVWAAGHVLTIARMNNLETQYTEAVADLVARVPAGLIVIWHGTIANIPAGWIICDGNNGTPNLLTKFVQGVATAATDPGATGGAATHTLIIAETPSHTHPISEGNAVGAGDFLPQTGSTGAGATDAIGGDGAHENEPTFYDIAFLMKS